MNVIGIVQTDLNEFNILFEPEQDQQGQQQGGDNLGQDDASPPDFFSLLLGNGGDQNPDDKQQQGPQEMTVRIKGIPEGQKATFLQMYQIIQDAQESRDIEQRCTVVAYGDGQGQGQDQGSLLGLHKRLDQVQY